MVQPSKMIILQKTALKQDEKNKSKKLEIHPFMSKTVIVT